MTDTKISALGALAAVQADDLLAVVDVHDTTMAASGTTKKMTVSQVFGYGVSMTPVTLTDAATIAVNAALGNQFRVTLGGNRTLGAPSNPADGQIITVWFIQDGTGTRTIALAAGSGGYHFGTDLTSVTLSTAAGVTDRMTCQYDVNNTRWDVTGFLRGW